MRRKDSQRPTDRADKGTAPRGLDVRSLALIGDALKSHYEDLVQTPVPKKFLELLDQLDANERTSRVGSASDEPE